MGFLDTAMAGYEAYLTALREKGNPKVNKKIAALVPLSDPRILDYFSALLPGAEGKNISLKDAEFILQTLKDTGIFPGEDDIDAEGIKEIVEKGNKETLPDNLLSKLELYISAQTGALSPCLFVIFQQYIYLPLTRMRTYSRMHSPKYIREIRKEGMSLVSAKVSSADVYDYLKSFDNQEQAVEMLQELNCSEERRVCIINSYLEDEKDTFCNELEQGRVNLSSFKGLCLLGEYSKTLENEPSVGVATKMIRWVLGLFKSSSDDSDNSERQYIEDLHESLKDIDTIEELDTSNLEADQFKWLMAKLNPVQRLCYKDFTDIMDYIKTLCSSEQEVFQEVLDRREGQEFCRYFLSKYQGTTEDDQTEINESKFELDYSGLGFISEKEFNSWKTYDERDYTYRYPKTKVNKVHDVENSFVKATLMYEFLCTQQLIEHSPGNHYSFLYRFTSKRRESDKPERFAPILYIDTDRSKLAYFIGRALWKLYETRGDGRQQKTTAESGISKPHFENHVWDKTFSLFFDTTACEAPYDKSRIAEAAKYDNKPSDTFREQCNELFRTLFGELN